MIALPTPLHSPTKREFARGPMRFALRWKKELHNKDQAPLTTSSSPSKPVKPVHGPDLFRPILLPHPGQHSTNQTPNTFLKDSLRGTL